MTFLNCLNIKNLITNSSVLCNKLYKFLFWITLIAVLYFAFAPNLCIGPHFENSDKYKHMFAFFVLTNFFVYAYKKSFKQVWFWMFVLGIFIEFVQYFEPTRESSFFDLLADVVGILIATIFIWIEKSFFKLNYKKDKR